MTKKKLLPLIQKHLDTIDGIVSNGETNTLAPTVDVSKMSKVEATKIFVDVTGCLFLTAKRKQKTIVRTATNGVFESCGTECNDAINGKK